MRKFPGFFVLLSLVMFLSACSISLAGDITPPPGSEQEPPVKSTQSSGMSANYPIVPPNLANGALIYNQECAQCHGITGLGDGPQSSQISGPVASLGLSDFARMFTPAEWYTVVTEGNQDGFMPAFSRLTDRQRWDVVAYAMNLAVPAGSIDQGRQLFQDNCTVCHGLSANGDGPAATGLSRTPRDLSDQSFISSRSADNLFQAISTGVAPDMPGFTGKLDESQRWALVSYLRSLTYADQPSEPMAYPGPGGSTGDASTPYPPPQGTAPTAITPTQTLTTTAGLPTTPFTGTVAVELLNGSGGEPPSDATVTLYGFDNMQNTFTATLSTGVSGVYTFTEVYMPEERVFLAGAEYASGTYGSDIVTVNPVSPDLKLQVTVFDSTSDTSALATDRLHIFFDFSDPQNVQVIEVFIISNSSRLAIVPPTPEGTVITFPLPQGYTNLQFQDGSIGDRYMEVEQGFADRMTVNPGLGDYQVIFAFQMPYNRKLDFSQVMALPTSAVVVMLPDNGIKIDSDQLRDSGIRDFQGSSYRMYDGSSLIAGSSLELTLSGNPQKAGVSLTTTTQDLTIGIGVLGVVLVGVGLWLYRRNQTAALQSAAVETLPADVALDALPGDEETLVDAIISLDDQYHAGNLPEEAYLERRALLKERLRQVTQG